MAILTFAELHAEVAAFHAAEAARNAPEAVARRAIYTLASAMAELSTEDRHETFLLLTEEVCSALATPAPVVACPCVPMLPAPVSVGAGSERRGRGERPARHGGVPP